MIKSNIILIMLIISLFSGNTDFSDTFLSTPSSIPSESTLIENEETIAFNKDLKLYIGNNLSDAQIRTLINMIQTSNSTNQDKQIIMTFNSIEYTDNNGFLEAINDISSTASYTVYFEYSPLGFINKSIITENIIQSPSPSITPTATPSTDPAQATPGENTASPSPSIEPTPTITSTPIPTPTPTPTPIHGNVSTTVTF